MFVPRIAPTSSAAILGDEKVFYDALKAASWLTSSTLLAAYKFLFNNLSGRVGDLAASTGCGRRNSKATGRDT